MFDHSGKSIVHDQLSKVQCDPHFKHPQAVDHVDACQRSKEPGECFFVTGLGVTEFAVALSSGRKTGDGIFSRQLGCSGGNHAAFR